jgi:hypothetical protein
MNRKFFKFLALSVTLLQLIALFTPATGLAGPAPGDQDLAPAGQSAAPGLNQEEGQGDELSPQQALACPTPVTQTIRGKSVEFDQCYEQTFSHDGTDYTIHAYYTEANSTTNTNQCNATENAAGRCEHALSDNDDANGDNVNAVALANEAESALRFYIDRDLQVLSAGATTLTIYIAEDPRLGGVVWPNSIYVDDDAIDNNDTLQKRLLAYHEIQHLVQDKYDSMSGWRDFFGEGIARAIEDRVDTALDADTGHLFIPEVNGILSSNAQRTNDLSTISYRSVLWWTWLMDQYRDAGEINPVLGWPAIRDFYLELDTESDQLKALSDYVAAEGSAFRDDFIDYTLALYAYRFSPGDPRLGFLDTQINATAGLRNHTIFNSGPSFSTDSPTMSPRSSRYWEFTPGNQCDYIAFTFDGGGQPYGFSVMTVDGGTLQNRWTSYSSDWTRTVRSAGLDRVVGVVSAVDSSGTVQVGRGCVAPTVEIKSPTTSAFAMVGLATNPRHFIVRLRVRGADDSPVSGLLAQDFQVQIRKAGGGALIDATVVNAAYVQADYWLLVQAPSDADGAESGAFYDLVVTLGSSDDTETSAVLYVERTQDTVIVLDRSGSMGGSTGKIEAARNAANLLVNELSANDQGAFVAFDHDADLRVGLDMVTGTHRATLFSAIASEVPGGLTSIGDGLRTAATEEDANGLDENMCSLILLSDGHENDPDFWSDVQAQVVDNGCAIHAVALGPGTNELLLQQIAAAVPGGSYDFAPADGGVPIRAPDTGFMGWENNLSRIYDFKASQIAGRQRLSTSNGGPSNVACVDFEDLSAGARYNVGDSFVDSGAWVTGKTFYWRDGTAYAGGYTEVDDQNLAGGSGNDLQVNNINLDFDFGAPVAGLTLRAYDGGGNLNIEINGEFLNFDRLTELDGLDIGGVSITVIDLGNDQYQLVLDGLIQSFAIGGQELWIDDVCPQGQDGLTFYVDDASDQLVVSIAWQNPTKGGQLIQLYDPDGDPVASSHRRIAPTGTNEVWEVPDPQEGQWTLEVKELSQEYFVSATARTSYEMYLFVGTPIADRTPGTRVPLLVTFVGQGKPLLDAQVVATVRAPNGTSQDVQLLDDGNHGDGAAGDGIYGGDYTATEQGDQVGEKVGENQEPQVVGSYLVNAVGTWKDLRREAQGSFAIEGQPDTDGDGLPDPWEEKHGLDPNNPEDAYADFDRDGLDTRCEFQLGTDPFNSDTDGGGESDGSETGGRCFPGPRDPLNPDDDRVGPLTSLIALPRVRDELLQVELLIGSPLWGRFLSADVYRQVYTPTQRLAGDWQLISTTQHTHFIDPDVEDGVDYRYQVVPLVEMELPTTPLDVTAVTTATGRVLVSNVAQASSDPYAPGGSVLIDDGAEQTERLSVTLRLAADDNSAGHVESEDAVQGSPLDEIMMRLSNSPDFMGATWQPFQATVEGWDLGDVSPGQMATVYVQFKDAKGNVSDVGFGQMDTIRYVGKQIFLPLILKSN